MTDKSALRKLHSIESLGVVSVTRGEVRVERLEDRLAPRVPFPHKHDFYHLLFVTSGKGWHEIDFERYPIAPRQVFVMKPGQVHSWRFAGSARGIVIEFTPESLEASRLKNHGFVAKLAALPDRLVPAATEWRILESLCESMRDEFKDRRQNSELCLRDYLSILLIHLFRAGKIRKDATKEKREDAIELFADLVEQNFMKEHRVEFYAEKLGISAKALTMRASRTLGRSARTVIQDRCLLEAKRLLAYSDLSVAQISYELGFDDPNYFSRLFRKRARSSPLEFRSARRRTSAG